MPLLTTIDGLLERMVTATENLLTNIPAKLAEYLPLTGGTITGNLDVDGTLKNNNENVLTSSFITTVTVSLTGTVAANNWGDFTGTITYPSGYSHALGIRRIIPYSSGNMTLVGWDITDTTVKARIYSRAAYTNASFDMVVFVTK